MPALLAFFSRLTVNLDQGFNTKSAPAATIHVPQQVERKFAAQLGKFPVQSGKFPVS